jgi:hypothetical protein
MDEARAATGSLVVPAARVRVTGEAVRIGPPPKAGEPEPKVEVVREGDAIRAIHITCTCGEKIAIRCDYA